MNPSFRLIGILLLSLAGMLRFGPASLAGESKPPKQEGGPAPVDFAKDIRPLLQARCFTCHGPQRQKADLRLDRKDAALKGGESGAVIVPGKAGDSLLLKRIASTGGERMPPTGEPLTADQLKLVRTWIEQGAPWPESAAVNARPSHWAFQSVVRPAIPPVAEPARVGNAIDHFILARLTKEDLHTSAEADRVTLIRRLKFDLLGLPPAPEEVEAFVQDKDANAYEKLVDRYLASPHFGERWARHWLDVVRFAESHGFEMNQVRANAWPYRDYVIRSINEDKPYDQFIREQLAGDKLGAQEATSFLVGGPWDQVKSPDKTLILQQRADELHDMVATTSSAFLGLTAGCARCHNHKFDPITQLDYYGLKAVFAGVQHGERRTGAGLAEINPRRNVERFSPVDARFLRMTIQETTDGKQPCIDEIEVYTAGAAPRNVALASLGTRATASSTLPGHAIHKVEHLNDGRHGNRWSWISNEPGRGWIQLEFPEKVRIDRVVWSRDGKEDGYGDRLPVQYHFETAVNPDDFRALVTANPSERGTTPALPAKIYAGRLTVAEPTHRLHRGDPLETRETVAPAALAAFGARMQLALDAPEQERRLALAKWIADPQHPLTARVLVNRLWQHHFGTGIVSTPSDFGINGARPTHPELLDWLASEFVANGWKMKPIHRLIVLSNTYRQTSTANPKGLAADASARLLWRYSPRRLEAEPLRDATLFVSGKLELRMGGPGFDLFQPNSNYVKVYTPKQEFGPIEWRRMIYQTKPRMQLDDTFGAFDCPDAGQIAPKRTVSITALQALNLLNSRFQLQQVGFFAERLQREVGGDPAAQVRRGFASAFQREPSAEESAAAVKLVQEHGLPALCRALFNANEFLFVF